MATKASPEDVRRLAALSRIDIPESDLEHFVEEFDAVLAYVGTLEELTLPGVGERTLPGVRNKLRPDGEPHTSGVYTERIVEQFPEKEGNYLSVKQILSHD